ncbi:unnamed protein product [Sphagnum balticum]
MVCQRCARDRKFNINFVVADVYTFFLQIWRMVRVFQIVASLVGLQLVTSLVAVTKSLGQSCETAQRQLNAEKKKQKECPRIESLNKILSEKHEKITMVEEMMRKMFTGCKAFVKAAGLECLLMLFLVLSDVKPLVLDEEVDNPVDPDLYLKYIGWTLNDKNPVVRKSSISALQELYAVDDNVPSLSLFTARFGRHMVEMADDVDMSVAISAIGLLKQLLRHRLLSDEDLGSLYDLLIDDAPQICHAVGDLVYDHLICPASEAFSDFGTAVGVMDWMDRILQILSKFSADPILCDYVIDALWDKCQAVKEALETRKKEMTLAMVKSHAKLLRKYLANDAKVAAIVEIILHMQLSLYSLKRQEQARHQ